MKYNASNNIYDSTISTYNIETEKITVNVRV